MSMRTEEKPCETWFWNYLIVGGGEEPYVEAINVVSQEQCLHECHSKPGCSGVAYMEVQEGPDTYRVCDFSISASGEPARMVNMDLVRELTPPEDMDDEIFNMNITSLSLIHISEPTRPY